MNAMNVDDAVSGKDAMNGKEYVLTFGSTHDAMLAEQALLTAGLAPGIMPLPSAIRAGCGLCVRIACPSLAEALGALTQAACAYQEIYLRRVRGGKSLYENRLEGDGDEAI